MKHYLHTCLEQMTIKFALTSVLVLFTSMAMAQKIFNLSFDELRNGKVYEQVNELEGQIYPEGKLAVVLDDDGIASCVFNKTQESKIIVFNDNPSITGHDNNGFGHRSLTIEFSIKPNELDEATLISKMDSQSNEGFYLGINNSGKLYFVVNNGAGQSQRVVAKQQLRKNQWHNIIATWDSHYDHYNVQLHLDGVIAWGGSGPVIPLTNTVSPLTVGGGLDTDQVVSKPFSGAISGMQIAINQSEIMNLPGLPVVDVKSTGDHLKTQSGYVSSQFVYDIPPTPECHASTIVDLGDDKIAAAWFGGTHEGHTDVAIWWSVYNGKAWSEPKVIIRSPVHNLHARISLFNPVLFKHSSGSLMLFYKEGWVNSMECRLLRSMDNGITWSEIDYLEKQILGPSKNKLVEGPEGQIICPSSANKIEISYDKGLTWKSYEIDNPKGFFGVIQPTLIAHSHDTIQALFRTRESRIAETWSSDTGRSWSPLKLTKLPNNNSGLDAVSLSDGRFILVSNPTEIPKGKWGGPRTPLVVSVSEDGHEWKQALVLEDESGEFSYPSVIQSEDGLIHIIYTWKRIRMKHVIINPELI